MGLRWELHTLDGQPRAGLGPDHREGKVELAFNGERTAEVKLSIFDEACGEVIAGRRLLKAWWDELGDAPPVFTGPVLLPQWEGEAGTVTISAIDASWRLDHAPLLLNPIKRARTYWRGQQLVTAEDYGPPSYESLDHLIEAARPAAYGFPDPEIPDHGVARYLYAEGEAWRKPMPVMEISRGESVWALMGRLSQSVFGPDFDLRPIDQAPGSWDYCELDIWTRRGAELQDDAGFAFHYRLGQNNVVDAGYRPSADQLTNAYFSAYTLGENSDTEKVVNYYDPGSIGDYGFVAQYESSGCDGSAGKGIAHVSAYRLPPRFFTFKPAIEGYTYAGREDTRFGVPPMILRDYGPGDTVRVIARRGYFDEELVGRVSNVTLNEVGDAGDVQAEVTIVPRVGIDGIEANLEEA